MRMLLDTHAILWWLDGSPRLGAAAADYFQRQDVELFASIASLWEIAIKRSVGKLEATSAQVAAHLAKNQIVVLPIEAGHLGIIEQLPHLHRDPFDRMIIAQALGASMPIMTDDAIMPSYGVPCIPAMR